MIARPVRALSCDAVVRDSRDSGRDLRDGARTPSEVSLWTELGREQNGGEKAAVEGLNAFAGRDSRCGGLWMIARPVLTLSCDVVVRDSRDSGQLGFGWGGAAAIMIGSVAARAAVHFIGGS